MKSASTNTFNDGLVRDLNELTTSDKVMTYCLNGTLVTFNGNEFSLQNDMGNARIGTAYLPDGYVPVGMKEYGGIIYVASYNPQTKKGQIGSFPSPKRLYIDESNKGSEGVIKLANIIDWRDVYIDGSITPVKYPFIKNDYYGGEITDDILHNGDWFALASNIGTNYNDLINNNILSIDLAVKTKNRLIPIESTSSKIPFTNIEESSEEIQEALQNRLEKILTTPEYNNLNIFNSKYSGSLYYILNYKTLEDWNIVTQVSKGENGFTLTYTPNCIINNSEVTFEGAVYEDLNNSSKYTDITDIIDDKKIPTQTIALNESINGYLIPYTNYGVLERLKLGINYTYGELDDGLDKLTEYYYEYKQGSNPEEDYIYLRIGYQYLSWTDDTFDGLKLKFYDLDYPDRYNKIITETGEIKKKNPLFTLDINPSEGIFNRSKILYFKEGFIKNKIYIVDIYKIINGDETLVSTKTMYTSPIINSIGYNNYSCPINFITNNNYSIINEETYYSTQSKDDKEVREYIDTEISIDKLRNIYKDGKQPITYIKHIDKYKLDASLASFNTSINSNIYSNDELCVTVKPDISYTASVNPINNSNIQIEDNSIEITDNELTLTQYKYIYATLTQKPYNGSVKQLRRAFNPLNLENSDIGTRMVANPISYMNGSDRNNYSEAFNTDSCSRVIHIFGLDDAGNCVIENGKGTPINEGKNNDIAYYNSLSECCDSLNPNNDKATMCFGYSYKSWRDDKGNPYSIIYEGTGRDSESADDAKGIEPNKNFFRFNNRGDGSTGYDPCINYSGAKKDNNQAIDIYTDFYYQFVALKTYDPLNYSDGYKDSSNWAVIDLFRYGNSTSGRGEESTIRYDSFICDIAYAAYVYFSQILVPVRIDSNKNVWTIDNIIEDDRDIKVNVNIIFNKNDNSIIEYNGKDYLDIISKWNIQEDGINDTKFISYIINDNLSFSIDNKCDILSSVKNIYILGKDPFMPDLEIDEDKIYLLKLGDNENEKINNLLNLPTIIDDISLVKDVKMEGTTVIEDPKIEEFNHIAKIGETSGATLSYLRDWLVPESHYTKQLSDFNPLYVRLGTKGIGTTNAVKQIIYSQWDNMMGENGHKEPGPLFIHFGFSDKSSYLSRSYN